MFRWGLLLLLIIFASAVSGSAAELNQRDWMEQLTDSLGWGYGLPDDPVTEDYIALLSGHRDVFVEAETNRRRSDRVAVKKQTNFGNYSGSGWVSGRREPVTLHLDLLIPRNGRYRLSVATRLPGVMVQVAGQEFIASAGQELMAEDLGTVSLAAGPTEVVVNLPPDAGIDYLHFVAPPLPRIAPLDGWQPDQPLQTTDLALTMLQALELIATLPATDRVQTVEAETSGEQRGVQKITDRHLGAPSNGQWVRSGYLKTNWQFPVSVQESGCYQLFLRGSSQAPVEIAVAGFLDAQLEFGSALTTLPLGNYCLSRGQLLFELELPPWAGIDSLEMRALDTRPEILARLLGLPDRLTGIQTQTLNEMLQLLSRLTR